MAPMVPTARPIAAERVAPTRAPTPARPVTTPSWNGSRSSASSANGARTTPMVALPGEPDVRGDRDARQARPAVHPPHALPDLAPQVRLDGRRTAHGLLGAQGRHGGRRHQEGAGVDEHGERRAHDVHEHAGQGRPGRLGDGVGAVEPGVGALQVLAGHEAGHERLRGRVVDEGRDAEGRHDDEQERQRQHVRDVRDRDEREQRGPRQVGHDHDRPAWPPVHQRADEEAEDEVRQPARRAHPADLLGRAVEGQHHQGLQREQGDVAAEPRDGLAGPEPAEAGRRERARGHVAHPVTSAKTEDLAVVDGGYDNDQAVGKRNRT